MKTEISPLQEAFRNKLLAIKESKNLKNNELASITGRSESVISELLNNKRAFADTLVQSMMARLADYMHEYDLVPVRQYQVMQNIAAKCKEQSDIRLMVGNTGIGKTVCMKRFASREPAVYYIKIFKTYTWHKFLIEICRVMGIPVREGTGSTALLEQIIEKVEQISGEKPLLIIDEAEILNQAIWKQIKNLYTATEGLLGILIVGISSVKKQLAQWAGLQILPAAEQATATLEQFRPFKEDNNIFTTFVRRLKVLQIDSPKGEDIAFFCQAKGIKNDKVIQLAATHWWNYAMADITIKALVATGVDLDKITEEEFNLI